MKVSIVLQSIQLSSHTLRVTKIFTYLSFYAFTTNSETTNLHSSLDSRKPFAGIFQFHNGSSSTPHSNCYKLFQQFLNLPTTWPHSCQNAFHRLGLTVGFAIFSLKVRQTQAWNHWLNVCLLCLFLVSFSLLRICFRQYSISENRFENILTFAIYFVEQLTDFCFLNTWYIKSAKLATINNLQFAIFAPS